MAAPRGAGRGGGLLFIAVLVFTSYLLLRAVAGLAQLVLLIAVVLLIVVTLAGVLRRR